MGTDRQPPTAVIGAEGLHIWRTWTGRGPSNEEPINSIFLSKKPPRHDREHLKSLALAVFFSWVYGFGGGPGLDGEKKKDACSRG